MAGPRMATPSGEGKRGMPGDGTMHTVKPSVAKRLSW